MYTPKSIYVKLALDAIVEYVTHKRIKKPEYVPDELSVRQACFVSLHLTDGDLRGCIGTIEPHLKNLGEEIIQNAIHAATMDTRFVPVSEDELEDITVSVDVLSIPKKIKSIDELDPKNLGVIVSDKTYRKGLLLPDIEGIDTIEEQLYIAKKKAGIFEPDNSLLDIYSFTTTRYY